MKKWSFVALLVVGATILGATVLREPIARAAQTVDANIIGPLDGNGNVKVHEQGTASVNAAQTGTWSTRDRDNPALQPYAKLVQVPDIPNGEYTRWVEIQVPRGKRLVIEDVSALAQGPAGQAFEISISLVTNGENILRTFTGSDNSPSTVGDNYTIGSATRLYIDPGSTFIVQFLRDSHQHDGVFHIAFGTLSGYLIDAPASSATPSAKRATGALRVLKPIERKRFVLARTALR
jgi:hypothetical protein